MHHIIIIDDLIMYTDMKISCLITNVELNLVKRDQRLKQYYPCHRILGQREIVSLVELIKNCVILFGHFE
jgi:hypothetical protein